MFQKAGLWIPRSGCSCLFPYGSGFMQIRIHECPDPQPCQKRYPSGWNTHGLVSWIRISICPCGYGSSSDADPYDLLYGNGPGSGSWISKLLITDPDPDPRVYKKNPTNIFSPKIFMIYLFIASLIIHFYILIWAFTTSPSSPPLLPYPVLAARIGITGNSWLMDWFSGIYIIQPGSTTSFLLPSAPQVISACVRIAGIHDYFIYYSGFI